jgi:hypothetical protein
MAPGFEMGGGRRVPGVDAVVELSGMITSPLPALENI